ncbi:MAG TPA: cytochrome c [Blastocatellia bacterium]|nr:cytochrome c [Blastocatellia bacterium]
MIRPLFKQRNRARVIAIVLLPLAIAMGMIGCRQDMHDQPKYVPLRPVDQLGSITDGRSARPLVEGTVARDDLRDDVEFYTGRLKGFEGSGGSAPAPAPAQSAAPPPQQHAAQSGQQASVPAANSQQVFRGYVTELPMSISKEDLDAGQERFNIYCAVCHGPLGYGDGMIVKRGFRKPPSYHEDRLRQAPVGYFFDVISNGFGTMPDYASQIEPAERWKIVAYIRALQLSQNATISDVPENQRSQLNARPATKSEGHNGEEHK